MGIKSPRDIFYSFTAALVLALFSIGATAGTIYTSVTLPTQNQIGPANFTSFPITGLHQFDPSNGILTGIKLSLGIEYYDIRLSLVDWDSSSSNSPFAYASMSAQISITADLPAGGGLFFASTSGGDTIFDELEPAIITGTTAPPEYEDAADRLKDGGIFDDFIGTGDISILGLAIVTFSEFVSVTLEDGTETTGDLKFDSFEFGPSTIGVEYTFRSAPNPNPVPVPATLALLGLGIAGLGWSRRKKA